MTWAALAPLMLQVLVQLPALIQAAEDAFGGQRKVGPQKREFVVSAVDTAIGIAAKAGAKDLEDESKRAAIREGVGALTDATVAVFNAVDVWRTKDKPQA